MRRLLHWLPVLALDAPTAGQPVDAAGLEISAGEYGKHTGHGARGARVDGLDFRMRVRRAHENASDHLGPLDIGDVIAAPGQEAEILLAAWGSANPDYFGHGSLSSLCSVRGSGVGKHGGQRWSGIPCIVADVAFEPMVCRAVSPLSVLTAVRHPVSACCQSLAMTEFAPKRKSDALANG